MTAAIVTDHPNNELREKLVLAVRFLGNLLLAVFSVVLIGEADA